MHEACLSIAEIAQKDIFDSESDQVGNGNTVCLQENQFIKSIKELGINMQGTEVIFVGEVVMKEEAPKECLTLRYIKNDPDDTHYNYFSC